MAPACASHCCLANQLVVEPVTDATINRGCIVHAADFKPCCKPQPTSEKVCYPKDISTKPYIAPHNTCTTNGGLAEGINTNRRSCHAIACDAAPKDAPHLASPMVTVSDATIRAGFISHVGHWPCFNTDQQGKPCGDFNSLCLTSHGSVQMSEAALPC